MTRPQEYARFDLPASNPNLPSGEHRLFKAVRAARRAAHTKARQARAAERTKARDKQNDILKRCKKERRHLDDEERSSVESLNDRIFYLS